MKKYFNYAFASAIALAGASGFTACSSDSLSDLSGGNTNPTYDAKSNSVTTQFVLNVAANTNESGTRQSADIVQKNANFRGMQDAKLIGLATGNSSYLAPYNGEDTQTDWTTGTKMKAKVYDLGTLYGSTAVDNTENKNRDESSHRIVELTLPVTTDAMLVYGRAIPHETVAQNGKVTMPASYAAPENITFGLTSRLEDKDAYEQTCNLAALIFDRIMLSQVDAHAMPIATTQNPNPTPEPRNGYIQKADLPALKWRTIGIMTQEDIDALSPLEQKLAIAYKVVRDTYKDPGSVHAGSAAAICNVIDDIYSIADETAKATATSDAELNAQRLADVIITRIGYYFDRTTVPTKFHDLGDAGTDGSVKKYLIDNAGVTAAQFDNGGNYGKVTNAYLKGYPHAFNIPDGVAQLTFEDFGEGTPITGGFKFKTLANSSSLIDISSTLNPSKYTYPAELLYFDNSLLRVNDNEVAAADYPNGYKVWDENAWTGWTTGPVATTTRSVAVKNNINYGVAMLGTKVDYDGTVGDNFEDNRPAAEGVKLAENDIKKLTLTGVLIGGQYQNVGWNFIRKNENDDNKNFVIFDNQIANGAIPTPDNAPNYTLVFDNYSDDNGNVRVALEFTNNSEKDIYGLGGMIPKGGVFYLAGVLNLATNTETITWPTYYAIPPYTDAGGTNTEKKRVFIQDYLTNATFKIGRTSLKNAYTTIPDLRASQISLGLSVDLNWRQGLNFNVDF